MVPLLLVCVCAGCAEDVHAPVVVAGWESHSVFSNLWTMFNRVEASAAVSRENRSVVAGLPVCLALYQWCTTPEAVQIM